MWSRRFWEEWEAARLLLNRVRIWLVVPERTHRLLRLLWPIVALIIAVLVLRRASSAKDLADLISAIASLMWPLVALAMVGWFRPEIRAILTRIRKGKIFGLEIELDELQAKTEAAEATASRIASASGSVAGTSSATAEGAEAVGSDVARAAVEEVLREASRSSRVGLMLLSAKIEQATREMAADVGFDASFRPLGTMIRMLAREELISLEDAEALLLFYQVRNRIVHEHDMDEGEIARAIDSGTRLLRLLLSRPRPQPETDRPRA